MERIVSRDRLATLLDHTPVAVLVCDIEGRIRWVNRIARDLFAGASSELVGLTVERLMPEGMREAHRGLRARFHDAPSTREMGPDRILRARRLDGSEFFAEIGLCPLGSDEEGPTVAVHVLDVTARRRQAAELRQLNAELARSNDELDRFAHVAGHDLRAPLRAISGLAGCLEEDVGGLGEEAREYLERIQGRITHMDDMLTGLLEFAQVGAGRGQAESISRARLEAEVRGLVELTGAARLEFRWGPPNIETHLIALRQVLANLVNNAVRHHDRGGGPVGVHAHLEDGVLHVAVEDDGPGIPPDHRDEVFEPFRTLRSKDRGAGTGLGMAIVRRRIESQGGAVRIEDVEGGGARVCFDWPL